MNGSASAATWMTGPNGPPLGSYHDAEDAMQDVLLRAWRSLDTYEDRAPLLHWLYRIATTTSLKIIQKRARQPATVAEIDYLEPYPDRLLDPAVLAEQRESVSLAFITALQLLPATQRAVLILREVLAWTAAETANLLDSTVPAVNSMLQRARATLRGTVHKKPLTDDDHTVLAQFTRITGFPSCELSQKPHCAPSAVFTALTPQEA